MGKANSKLRKTSKFYKKHKDLNSRKKGHLQTKRHSSNHNLVKLLKTFNSSTFNLEPDEFKVLAKRRKTLPKEFFPGEIEHIEDIQPGLCSPGQTQITIAFESRTLNLQNLTNGFGKIYNERDALNLIYYGSKAGSVMQSRLDYFPELKLKNIYVDEDGLRLENPYIYDEYVHYILNVSKSCFRQLIFKFILTRLECCSNQRSIQKRASRNRSGEILWVGNL